MQVNSDFSKVAALKTSQIAWVKSPMPGVDRRMLDRVGEEVARATSIVRYAPESRFSAHTHSGGEEFIVLEGTFQDEHGDYPAGSYVRNPIGTRHIPRSDDGCVIFVKLWQFAADDNEQFALDLNRMDLEPDLENEGIRRASLHRFGNEIVMLEEWAAGTRSTIESERGAEMLLLAGNVEFDGKEFGPNDWSRLPAGYAGQFQAGAEGARIWIKTGHLADIQVP